MSQSFDEAMAKFSGEVDDAVSRARRAAAEARELTARLRTESRQEPSVPPTSEEDDDFSQEQIMTRD
ncbi:hypothetical protein DMH04_49065 [Kibdelosporangium aridum]|uniref:Uncharacterized protein n=1 Tax=Kibdelosporangium aridum TaxID=2030 RepID=A0A428YIV6_KIBAR|nr:hypothetical protein [Kibdelosporangium aridum]RSM67411.1 hypothetical protein DMH04_49065 [Kibdelosporangium aridum]